MKKALVVISLVAFPLLSHANSTMVAKMPHQAIMQIIMSATTCKNEPMAILLGPDGERMDQTCNVEIGKDAITLVFAGYGKPLRMPRSQFETVDVDASGAERNTDSREVRLSVPQRNAVRSARQYLSFQGFSRDGLIHQLSSDFGSGYDVADATVAVDSLNVDWNEQAARSARQYLSVQGFSCRSLIQQLSSSAGSSFTEQQARYGAERAGACSK